jgi:signal transduction histidine kinase
VEQSGNGIDLAAVYQLMLQMSGRLNHVSGRLDQVSEHLDVHERKLDDLGAGLTDLRAAVTNYHSAVLGHGILISDLDERVRRIERHLKLETTAK